MKQQLENAIEVIKNLEGIDGCITGSALLGYFPDSKQDVDVFVYSEAAFTKLLYTLKFNPMFLIIDPVEKWKADDWCNSSYKGSIKKIGLVTIKFVYNLSIEVNIIFKERNRTIFDVLSTFDMDIIAKGYDLKTKRYLDLSENKTTNIATWNKWNPAFYNCNIWAVSRILRQLERCFKYTSRGYNTDNVVIKYKEILNSMLDYDNIFNSEKVDEKVATVQKNSKILIKIIDAWLEHHKISETELELLRETVKQL